MYTIQFRADEYSKRDKILEALQARIVKDGKFKATLTPVVNYGWKGTAFPAIRVKPVRMAKKRLYCGAHFGECPVDAPKKNATYLEYEDWVKFHKLVNSVLNKFRTDADVWTTPTEVRGKYWIRKGTKARKLFDATVSLDQYGRRVQNWNLGDASQF
jgi:hypothetical protein